LHKSCRKFLQLFFGIKKGREVKYIIMLLFCFTNLLIGEGFVAGTLVHMHQGLIAIENINNGDYAIIDHGNQTLSYTVENTTITSVHYCIKITLKDDVLCAAADQKLYVLNKGWVSTGELALSDLLLCDERKFVEIAALDTIYEVCDMYSIAVQESHVFCVTKHRIIVHNCEPIGAGVATIVVPICPPLAGAIILGEVIAAGITGFAAYLIHKKSKQEAQHNRYPLDTGFGNCPCGGKSPKHEDDEEEHPHGIYEDAGYHHFNSHGKKSACPSNGQQCLDKSFRVNEQNTIRITIENGKFVVLRESGTGKFHGYVVNSWKALCKEGAKTQLIRNAFQIHGLVNHAGKIIKNIV
jgi:hypothetical protein